MAKAKQVGKVLVATGQPRARPTPVAVAIRERELPPGVILEVSRLVPEARDALEPGEYEARIAEYQLRAESNLPLPLFGEKQPDVPEVVIDDRNFLMCWACGCTGQRKGAMSVRPFDKLTENGKLTRLAQIRAMGGETRRWAGRPFPQSSQNETYCPDCFDVWGWPDEYLAEVERLERESEELAREECERLARDRGANGGKPADGGARRNPRRGRAAVDV